mmetsp:Transcript_92173/g.192712  ORF Transcript_92173/g.192712 Transcript_92173/m.192712 type:complete len:110 (+) Transcript_92173:109-438(+)
MVGFDLPRLKKGLLDSGPRHDPVEERPPDMFQFKKGSTVQALEHLDDKYDEIFELTHVGFKEVLRGWTDGMTARPPNRVGFDVSQFKKGPHSLDLHHLGLLMRRQINTG